MYGMVANLDENMGRLMRLLKSESLDRDTILIFMTDNGTAAGARLDKQGLVTAGYNAGMRGKKTSPYDGGHRVPFFLRWPGGGLDGGRDVPELAAHLDVLPTLVDLCGLECPTGMRTDSVSLILQGELFEGIIPVEIATAGRYKITLRRWPEQLETPIRAAIDGGRALKITRAGVRLGTYRETTAVGEEAQSVSFTTELAAGEAELRAWFITEAQQRLGAYFVDIERLP